MHVDSWPESAERALRIAGLLFAASHVAFLVLLVVWFSLHKPTSMALFRFRLAAVLQGKPMPHHLPPPPSQG
jgi:hypothetical protein